MSKEIAQPAHIAEADVEAEKFPKLRALGRRLGGLALTGLAVFAGGEAVLMNQADAAPVHQSQKEHVVQAPNHMDLAPVVFIAGAGLAIAGLSIAAGKRREQAQFEEATAVSQELPEQLSQPEA